MKNIEKYKTEKERADAFHAFCDQFNDCVGCPLSNSAWESLVACAFVWREREAEEEKPLPCPFCGGKCYVGSTPAKSWVYCESDDCSYNSATCENEADAIAKHNRVARAAKDKASGESD